ncbi:MAG: hypothetical protein KatS3mg090_0719 [Patescibacteria group bacterium]|nr:MAG: hypothetical protein KatS3mg090_0719 [Patescibacteria group bacterium]
MPIFTNFGGLQVFTQGLFIVLGLFWALFFIWQLIALTSYSEEKIFDLIFLSIFSGLFWGRVAYFVFSVEAIFSPLRFILINGYPGFSFYGGLFGGLLTAYIFCVVKGFNFFEVMDYLSVGFLTAFGFIIWGRGISGELDLSRFDNLVSTSYYSVVNHFVPLYVLIGLSSLIFAFLSYRILMSIRKEFFPVGISFVFSIWSVSLLNYFISFFEDSSLYLINDLKFNQTVSLFLVLTSSIIFVYYFRSKIFEIVSFYFGYVKNRFQSRGTGKDKTKTD